MKFDYTILRKRIKASGLTIAEAGKITGMQNTLYRKITNRVGFSQTDIFTLSTLLNIQPEEIGPIFFTPEEN